MNHWKIFLEMNPKDSKLFFPQEKVKVKEIPLIFWEDGVKFSCKPPKLFIFSIAHSSFQTFLGLLSVLQAPDHRYTAGVLQNQVF